MKRLGRTHRPFYRVSVMDIRKARDGESIEDIGTYDPMVQDKSKRFAIKMERYDYWLSVGAQPSDNVAMLVKKLKTKDRKSTRLNSSHIPLSRMPSSA